ncbi:MAG: peptidoglycan editing factor PgeF [Clostridia bacterium]|nr:peptidoglycan editing factor PgeF [Clostridia bacterium]
MKSKTVTVNEQGDLTYITFPKLTQCGAVRHIFSTRHGGVSEGQFATMNLSFRNGDDRQKVRRNYEILCAAAGISTDHLVLTRQTHTANIQTVTAADCGTGYSKPDFSDIDGLITAEPNVALVTQFADCTPVLLCDPVKKVIANVHAGWRGTVQNIGGIAVERMVAEFGCRREDILAAIGPCVGVCCYEVDDPVYEAFVPLGIETGRVLTATRNGHYQLDLKLANRLLLEKSGVLSENIDVSDFCTCCLAEDFHSHRATAGKRGNLAAIIELKA